MAKVRDVQLNEALTERLQAVLEAVPDEVLLSAGREFLPGGFTKAGPIRRRLLEILRGGAALPPWFLDVLGRELPGRGLVESMSIPCLVRCMPDLETALGMRALCLSLLWDEREAVRKLGLERMGMDPGPVRVEEQQAAVKRLFDLYTNPMAQAFGEMLMDEKGNWEEMWEEDGEEQDEPGREDGFDAASLPPEAIQALEQSLRRQAKEIAELSAALEVEKKHLKDERKRHKSKWRELEEQFKSEQKRWQMEKQSWRDRLGEAETRLAAAEAQLKEREERQASLIRQGVEEETSFLVRPWLESARSLDQEIETARARLENVLERAEKVLESQARRDRHTGNRLELRKRMRAVTEARARIEEALRHAVHPLPELKAVAEELEGEVDRLRRLLGEADSGSVSRLEEQVQAGINLVRRPEDLGPLCRLIENLSEHGLLEGHAQRRLYGAVHRRFSLLEEAGQSLPSGGEAEEGWTLRRWIAANRPVQIMVDGHNVLFGLPDVYGGGPEAGPPGAEARKRLAEAVSRLLSGKDKVEAWLYFDGPTPSSESISTNVRVEFSGGEGRDRADQRIAMDLKFKQLQQAGRKVFVVSDDREVRHEALEHGARFVPVSEFAVLLGEDLAGP